MAITKGGKTPAKTSKSLTKGTTSDTSSSNWTEKRYPRGASKITSVNRKNSNGVETVDTSTFIKGHSGKTDRADKQTKNGKTTFSQRTPNY